MDEEDTSRKRKTSKITKKSNEVNSRLSRETRKQGNHKVELLVDTNQMKLGNEITDIAKAALDSTLVSTLLSEPLVPLDTTTEKHIFDCNMKMVQSNEEDREDVHLLVETSNQTKGKIPRCKRRSPLKHLKDSFSSKKNGPSDDPTLLESFFSVSDNVCNKSTLELQTEDLYDVGSIENELHWSSVIDKDKVAVVPIKRLKVDDIPSSVYITKKYSKLISSNTIVKKPLTQEKISKSQATKTQTALASNHVVDLFNIIKSIDSKDFFDEGSNFMNLITKVKDLVNKVSNGGMKDGNISKTMRSALRILYNKLASKVLDSNDILNINVPLLSTRMSLFCDYFGTDVPEFVSQAKELWTLHTTAKAGNVPDNLRKKIQNQKELDSLVIKYSKQPSSTGQESVNGNLVETKVYKLIQGIPNGTLTGKRPISSVATAIADAWSDAKDEGLTIDLMNKAFDFALEERLKKLFLDVPDLRLDNSKMRFTILCVSTLCKKFNRTLPLSLPVSNIGILSEKTANSSIVEESDSETSADTLCTKDPSQLALQAFLKIKSEDLFGITFDMDAVITTLKAASLKASAMGANQKEINLAFLKGMEKRIHRFCDKDKNSQMLTAISVRFHSICQKLELNFPSELFIEATKKNLVSNKLTLLSSLSSKRADVLSSTNETKTYSSHQHLFKSEECSVIGSARFVYDYIMQRISDSELFEPGPDKSSRINLKIREENAKARESDASAEEVKLAVKSAIRNRLCSYFRLLLSEKISVENVTLNVIAQRVKTICYSFDVEIPDDILHEAASLIRLRIAALERGIAYNDRINIFSELDLYNISKRKVSVRVIGAFLNVTGKGILWDPKCNFDIQQIADVVKKEGERSLEYGCSTSDIDEFLSEALIQRLRQFYLDVENETIDPMTVNLEVFFNRLTEIFDHLVTLPIQTIDKVIELILVRRILIVHHIPKQYRTIICTFKHLNYLIPRYLESVKFISLYCNDNISQSPKYHSIFEHEKKRHDLKMSHSALTTRFLNCFRENKTFFYFGETCPYGAIKEMYASVQKVFDVAIKEGISKDVICFVLESVLVIFLQNSLKIAVNLQRLRPLNDFRVRFMDFCEHFCITYPEDSVKRLADLIDVQQKVVHSSLSSKFRPHIVNLFGFNQIKRATDEALDLNVIFSFLQALEKLINITKLGFDAYPRYLFDNVKNVLIKFNDTFTESELLRLLSLAMEIRLMDIFLEVKSDLRIFNLKPLISIIALGRSLCADLKIPFPERSLFVVFDAIVLRNMGVSCGLSKKQLLKVETPEDLEAFLSAFNKEIVSPLPRVDSCELIKKFTGNAKTFAELFLRETRLEDLLESEFQFDLMFLRISDGIDNLTNLGVSLSQRRDITTLLIEIQSDNYLHCLENCAVTTDYGGIERLSSVFRMLCLKLGSAFPSDTLKKMKDVVEVQQNALEAGLSEFICKAISSCFYLEFAMKTLAQCEDDEDVDVALKQQKIFSTGFLNVASEIERKRRPPCNRNVSGSEIERRKPTFQQRKTKSPEKEFHNTPEADDEDDQELSQSSRCKEDFVNFSVGDSLPAVTIACLNNEPFLTIDSDNCSIVSTLAQNNLQAAEIDIEMAAKYCWSSVFATHGISKGKAYFETTYAASTIEKWDNTDVKSLFRVGWTLNPKCHYQLLPGNSEHSWAYSSVGTYFNQGTIRKEIDSTASCKPGDTVACMIDVQEKQNDEAIAYFAVMVVPKDLSHSAQKVFSYSIEYKLSSSGCNVWIPHIAIMNSDLKINFGHRTPLSVREPGYNLLSFTRSEHLVSLSTVYPTVEQKNETCDLIFTVGLPFTGKTSYVKEYVSKIDVNKAYVILSMESLVERFLVPDYQESLQNATTREYLIHLLMNYGAYLLFAFAVHSIRNSLNVIIDLCNASETVRTKRGEPFRKANYNLFCVVFCPGPKTTNDLMGKSLLQHNLGNVSSALYQFKANIKFPLPGDPHYEKVVIFGNQMEDNIVSCEKEYYEEAILHGFHAQEPEDVDEMYLEICQRFGIFVKAEYACEPRKSNENKGLMNVLEEFDTEVEPSTSQKETLPDAVVSKEIHQTLLNNIEPGKQEELAELLTLYNKQEELLKSLRNLDPSPATSKDNVSGPVSVESGEVSVDSGDDNKQVVDMDLEVEEKNDLESNIAVTTHDNFETIATPRVPISMPRPPQAPAIGAQRLPRPRFLHPEYGFVPNNVSFPRHSFERPRMSRLPPPFARHPRPQFSSNFTSLHPPPFSNYSMRPFVRGPQRAPQLAPPVVRSAFRQPRPNNDFFR